MTTSSQVVEAPAAVQVGSAHLVQEIELGRLYESARNPRRSMNQADLDELAASISEVGITVPLLVRPWSEDYEIVCGHRRFKAAVIAELDSAPCIVRNLTDEEAADIALIDNLQRVDVPALEEAEAFGELLDRLHSIAAVATKVGKEQGYVAKRLKLRTLTECSRQALGEQLITIDHALLLARLADDEQDEALKWCLDRNAGSKTPVEKVIEERLERRREREAEDPEERRHSYQWEPQSVVSLKGHIEEDAGTPLDRAPWALDDASLVSDAGACSACPKNTKANAPLFGDLNIGEPTCIDGACFKEKTAAFVRIQARVSEGTQAPLRISWKSTSTAPRQEKAGGGIALNQVFKYGQWIDIGKKGAKCEHMASAVTVDWSDANNRGYMSHDDNDGLRKPGEIIQVCIQPKCKVHKKSYEQQSNSNGGGHRVDAAEQKRQEEEKKRLEQAENKVRHNVFTAILRKLDLGTALRLTTERMHDAKQWRADVLDLDPKMPAERLEALIVFCHRFGRDIEANGYWLIQKDGVAKDRRELWDLAKAVGVKADEIAAAALPLALPTTVHDALYPASLRKQLKKAAAPAAAAKKAPAKKAAKLPAKKAAKKAGRK